MLVVFRRITTSYCPWTLSWGDSLFTWNLELPTIVMIIRVRHMSPSQFINLLFSTVYCNLPEHNNICCNHTGLWNFNSYCIKYKITIILSLSHRSQRAGWDIVVSLPFHSYSLLLVAIATVAMVTLLLEELLALRGNLWVWSGPVTRYTQKGFRLRVSACVRVCLCVRRILGCFS